VKPAADVNLRMCFAAVVPCPVGTGCLGVPFENRELRISALNHKPVNRIAGYQSANFTPEFLNRCHKLSIVKPLVFGSVIVLSIFRLLTSDQCITRSEYSGRLAMNSCTFGHTISTFKWFSRAHFRAVSASEEATWWPRNFSGTSV